MDYLQYSNFGKLEKINTVVMVLNLIINGLPSIQGQDNEDLSPECNVLNLIINGLPSILKKLIRWLQLLLIVLNLIINGLPSIPPVSSLTGISTLF